MTKPELILHIGHSKCGSTTIQRTLLANQGLLRDQNVFLFGRDLACSRDDHVKGMPNALLDNGDHWDHAADQVIAAAGAANTGDRFILSAEILGQPRMAGFARRLLNSFEIRIIHYIRPQTDWCYSAWKQWQVKRGLGLQEWVDRCTRGPLPTFWEAYEGYRDAGFDTDRYDMRILNRDFLSGGDLLTDFCHMTEIDADSFKHPAGQSNPNVDHALLEVFRASDYLFRDSRDNRAFEWVLRNLPEDVVRRRGGLTDAQQKQIMDAHQASNQAICDRFFSDRADAFWALFSAKNSGRTPDLSPEQARIRQLEGELEDLRRVVGYLFAAQISKDDSLPDPAIMEEAVKQWRETQGID